jgi:hypothetical protein
MYNGAGMRTLKCCERTQEKGIGKRSRPIVEGGETPDAAVDHSQLSYRGRLPRG